MSAHRIKLAEIQPNRQSFLHQQSVNQQSGSKHKKKKSVYQKPETRQYFQVKTEQREPISIIKQQQYTHIIQPNSSASKFKGKLKSGSNLQNKKAKKNSKHTISIINLTKNVEQSKVKGSSTVTKRKQSAGDFNSKLKQKIEDFRIISNCLEEYIKEQKRHNNEVNLIEIVKIISAFNRSEIAPISKPLQKLIAQIIESIQASIAEPKLKSILKKPISFESPSKKNHSQQDEQVKNTVKKRQSSKQFILKKSQHPVEVKNLQENLGRLKYESNRLKQFLEQIATMKPNENSKKKNEERQKMQRDKLDQLNKLREIAKQQEQIIKQLQDDSEGGTFRSDSLN